MDQLAYGIPEAAKVLGVCRATLYQQIRKGNLEVVKIGKRTLIRKTTLEAWPDALPKGKVA